MTMTIAADDQWIARMFRDRHKREYATAYMNWLRNDGEGPEPEYRGKSFMTGQAVRMYVGEYLLPERLNIDGE
jgi:hypothetical protein